MEVAGWLTDKTKTLTPRDIADDYFPRSVGVLIITGRDDEERGALAGPHKLDGVQWPPGSQWILTPNKSPFFTEIAT